MELHGKFDYTDDIVYEFDHSGTQCVECIFPISIEIKNFGCIQETTTSLVSSMTLVRAHSAASSSSLIIEFEDVVNPMYVDMSSFATMQTYTSQDTRETITTKNNINFVIVHCLCFQAIEYQLQHSVYVCMRSQRREWKWKLFTSYHHHHHRHRLFL